MYVSYNYRENSPIIRENFSTYPPSLLGMHHKKNNVKSNIKQKTYNLEMLREGFILFQKEYGRFPTALEVDSFPHLPTSRTIQRSWGGLEKLRKQLNLQITNYTKGQYRSNKSHDIGQRGWNTENKIEEILQFRFGEPFVHTQKRFGHVRADFYVYCPNGNFAIDVFCYEAKHSFLAEINFKQKTYNNFPCKIIFLAINSNFNQTQINNWIKNKRNTLPVNISVMEFMEFQQYINQLPVYKNPIP